MTTALEHEIRWIEATGKMELRADAEKRTVSGFGLVYGSLSADLGGFRERLLPGCASNAFAQASDVRLLVDHSMQKLLGRTGSGSLKLSDDPLGVRFECSVPATSYGNDLLALMARGDVSKCSFGFTVPAGGDRFVTEGNQVIREVSQLDLFEVSILTAADPAYTATSVNLRVAPAVLARLPENYSRISNCRRSLEIEKLRG